MQPKYQNYENGTGAEMRCPRCRNNCLHHEKIEVYQRIEDASKGLHFSICGSKAIVDTSLEGNPSMRCDGMCVTFWCEGCHGISVLSIAQHKGVTLVDLVDTGEDMKFNDE